jgi:sodium/bile acid cotransporter 7
MVIQVPWIQVSRSRSLLLRVKPAVFLVAIGMGAYVLHLFSLYFLSVIHMLLGYNINNSLN